MYLSLKKWFFWGGMRADCLEFCRSCDACKGESARFLRHSSLTPNDKGESPLQVWCVDLVTGLPPGSGGETIMIVCIDMFSKFVVAEALPDKSSLTVAVFFHKHIIC